MSKNILTSRETNISYHFAFLFLYFSCIFSDVLLTVVQPVRNRTDRNPTLIHFLLIPQSQHHRRDVTTVPPTPDPHSSFVQEFVRIQEELQHCDLILHFDTAQLAIKRSVVLSTGSPHVKSHVDDVAMA
jgi:hypothetical protein